MNVEQALRDLGFHWNGTVLKDSITRFQTAYCGPQTGHNTKGWLDTDGVWGPMTEDSMAWSLGNGKRLSTNFQAAETWCKHCGKNFVRRELLSGLELLRERLGNAPLPLLSVCRCPEHNKEIGGAQDSQHQYGTGADPKVFVPVSKVLSVSRFSGIGSRDGFKSACHIDVRHVFGSSPLNTTKSSIEHPMRFEE